MSSPNPPMSAFPIYFSQDFHRLLGCLPDADDDDKDAGLSIILRTMLTLVPFNEQKSQPPEPCPVTCSWAHMDDLHCRFIAIIIIAIVIIIIVAIIIYHHHHHRSKEKKLSYDGKRTVVMWKIPLCSELGTFTATFNNGNICRGENKEC